ncbi:Phosphoribosylglycinamide formyltransferase [invertebrate metagenome]|uniref:phosphoribosylglycinamide formyltransferase 1 n=1 Tax=invertebrate metagenome TaxID=1711999 RepID=A0A484H768_9ZZZZ
MKVAVLISGKGSNLQALIQAATAPDFPTEVIHVISNVSGAQGLAYAIRAGIPATVIDHRDHTNRLAFESVLDLCLRAAGTELICLAGFMRLLTADFVAAWQDRILNIHPSLLPAFTGLHTHKRVLEAGVRFTGCTVHFVRPAVDAGPIIAQAVVPVLPEDTSDLLAARVLEAEHRLYPLALELVATGRARVRRDVVDIDGAKSLPSQQSCFNPEGLRRGAL